jgi:hypothetical protein
MSFQITLSAQTLAEKIVVEKDCIEPTKTETTERWISSSINSNTGISSEWFGWQFDYQWKPLNEWSWWTNEF